MPRPKKSTEASANSIKKTEEQKKKRVRRSYLYAVGRRKRSIARVRLFKKGEGKIIINEKNYKEYLNKFFGWLKYKNSESLLPHQLTKEHILEGIRFAAELLNYEEATIT